MATAPTKATTTLVPKARNAPSPPALPNWLLSVPNVGTKGGTTRAVTATVSPEVGVGASKGESGSPVDARPVGVAVIETALSTISNAAQPIEKPAQYVCRWTRRGVSISPRP